jgi:hypothetical protein
VSVRNGTKRETDANMWGLYGDFVLCLFLLLSVDIATVRNSRFVSEAGPWPDAQHQQGDIAQRALRRTALRAVAATAASATDRRTRIRPTLRPRPARRRGVAAAAGAAAAGPAEA